MSQDVTTSTGTHPVADFVTRLSTRLDDLHTHPVPYTAMDPAQLRATLVGLVQAQARLDALRLGLMAHAELVGQVADPGDRNIADLLARTGQLHRPAVRAELKLAQALESEHPLLAAALARGPRGLGQPDVTEPEEAEESEEAADPARRGGVSVAQARAIVRSLALLPRTGQFATTSEQRTVAEEHLIDLAATHTPDQLEQIGRRIYEIICPEHAEAYEGTLLEAEEARAARKVSFSMWEDPHGICHGKFAIPRLHGHMLKKALQALLNPTTTAQTSPETGPETDGQDSPETNPETEPNAQLDVEATQPAEAVAPAAGMRDTRPMDLRRGEAFCELLERLRVEDLPTTGGGDATIVVTLTLAHLLGLYDHPDGEPQTPQDYRPGVATLDTGGRISAAQARRLAARHRLIPLVLGAQSQPLDLGRGQRLFSKAQRLVLAVTQGGCTAEHCTTPASMCQAHHDLPWSAGGPTDLTNARLLCGPHHRLLDDPRYSHETTPAGKIRYHRRE